MEEFSLRYAIEILFLKKICLKKNFFEKELGVDR
jgi:hypothetical protein